ncbi:MAG: RNA-binding protein [Methylococcaceae bacterium]|nr:RNA-binding protein [Methylococcaceae bacterium]
MLLFIANIPGDTLHKELIEFIGPVLKGGLFQARGEIKYIKILAIKDHDNDSVEYHAVTSILPDSVALRVIKKLNGKVFRGKRIVIREFNLRINKGDMIPNYHRRRGNLEVVELKGPVYTSQKSFNRIY